MQLIINDQLISYTLQGTYTPGVRIFVMMHGWGNTGASFDKLFVYMPDEVILRVDFSGFGSSPAPKSVRGVSDYAKCMTDIYVKLGISRQDSILMGHSFGGRVAIELASQEQYRGLILIGASGVQQGISSTTTLLHHCITPLKKTFSFCGLSTQYEHIAQRRRGADYNATTGIMKEIFLKVIGYDQTHLLKNIKTPTLIIHGDRDEATPLDYAYIFHREIFDSHIQIMQGVGHFPFQEQPQQVSVYIQDFLASKKI